MDRRHGIATGLAFDKGGSLYVGDRSGTIFKIAPDREIFVFATIEPSLSAYHLAFSPAGELFVTGPTTSSFDSVYRINPAGEVSTFFASRTPAGSCVRSRRQSLCRCVDRRQSRHRSNHPASRSRTCGQWKRHRWPRASAFAPRHDYHQQRTLFPRLGCRGSSASCLGRNASRIIAVGSELLTPYRLDTNSLYLTAELNKIGIRVIHKSVVGDSRDDIRATFRHALDRSELIVSCGGLGPTDDDRTRETVAELLGRELRRDDEVLRGIQERFRRFARTMPEN